MVRAGRPLWVPTADTCSGPRALDGIVKAAAARSAPRSSAVAPPTSVSPRNRCTVSPGTKPFPLTETGRSGSVLYVLSNRYGVTAHSINDTAAMSP